MTERLGEWGDPSLRWDRRGDEPPIQDKFVIQIPAKAGISSSPHSRRLVIPAKDGTSKSWNPLAINTLLKRLITYYLQPITLSAQTYNVKRVT